MTATLDTLETTVIKVSAVRIKDVNNVYDETTVIKVSALRINDVNNIYTTVVIKVFITRIRNTFILYSSTDVVVKILLST